MSENLRTRGDLVRYWTVNGYPVVENIVVTYAPNDWRACELPESIHQMYEPELARLASEAAGLIVDGDGSPADPETVVNRWLIESRSYTHHQVSVGDLLLEDAPEDSPLFHDVFKRKPRKGVKQITLEKYTEAVARAASKQEDDIAAWAEETVTASRIRWKKYADKLGEELATDFLGPIPTVADLVAGAAIMRGQGL